jgi:hypothetical protein
VDRTGRLHHGIGPRAARRNDRIGAAHRATHRDRADDRLHIAAGRRARNQRVTGGPLLSSFQAGDPAIPTGPIAPNLDDDDDPHAWHPVARLPTHGMRRRRRLDVYDADEPGIIGIDAMFRDTYVRADDQETIIHEYTVEATADRDSGVILQSRAIPRVLPWLQCPGASTVPPAWPE